MHTAVRAALLSAIALAVFVVPLLHAAHHHTGDIHDDAAMHATCVVCSSVLGLADAWNTFELSVDTAFGSPLPRPSAVSLPAILINTEAARGPPSSPA